MLVSRESAALIMLVSVALMLAAFVSLNFRRDEISPLRLILTRWATFSSTLLVAAVFGLVAYPHIRRPPENTQIAELEQENKILDQRWQRAKQWEDQVAGALSAAKEARRETSEARRRQSDAEASANTKAAELNAAQRQISEIQAANKQLEAKLAALESTTRDLRKQVADLNRDGLDLARTLRGAQISLHQCQRQRILIRATADEARSDGEVLRKKYEELAALSCAPGSLPPNRETSSSEGEALNSWLGARRDTSYYSVVPLTGTRLLVGRSGSYLQVTLRPNDVRQEFSIDKVAPEIKPSAEMLVAALDALLSDLAPMLRSKSKIELLFRAAADQRRIVNQPDPQLLKPYTTYEAYQSIAPGQYAGTHQTMTAGLPLENSELPNLRASFLAAMMKERAKFLRLQISTRVLTQRDEGLPRPIRPEVFIFIEQPP